MFCLKIWLTLNWGQFASANEHNRSKKCSSHIASTIKKRCVWNTKESIIIFKLLDQSCLLQVFTWQCYKKVDTTLYMCLGFHKVLLQCGSFFLIFTVTIDNFMHECCSNLFLYTYDIKMVGTCTFNILRSLSCDDGDGNKSGTKSNRILAK